MTRNLVKFQVEEQVFTNVNFARMKAEQLAEETGKDIKVYHNINGVKYIDIFTIYAKKD